MCVYLCFSACVCVHACVYVFCVRVCLCLCVSVLVHACMLESVFIILMGPQCGEAQRIKDK
jgi:hypothetical protein